MIGSGAFPFRVRAEEDRFAFVEKNDSVGQLLGQAHVV